MRNEIDAKISAYLRLAELCGTGDESKKKYYMEKVESLLLQHEDSLEDVFLHYIDDFSLDLIECLLHQILLPCLKKIKTYL